MTAIVTTTYGSLVSERLIVEPAIRPLLIGFGYKAQHGKDTAVAAIIKERGRESECPWRLNIKRYSFGDFVKAAVAGNEEALCKEHSLKYEPDNKNRSLLQWVAMKMRAEDESHWLRQVANKISAERPDVALISDVRFPNEGDWIRRHGGAVIRVERAGFKDAKSNPNHKTEQAMNNYQFDATVIAKTGATEALQTQALCLYDLILESARNLAVTLL